MRLIFDNSPDLEAAFEAVKGTLFGPLDPALVKLKHKEIIKDAKEKRDQDVDPRGRLSLARDDQAERDRKDRAAHTRTLTWLLANDRAYREAHERAMRSFTNAGNAIDRAIEAGEKARERVTRQIDEYLTSTARLSDGRYVMIDADGSYWDEGGQPISAEDIAEVGGQTIKPFKPYEAMTERKVQIDHDLAALRDWSVEVGDMHNKVTDNDQPSSREELDGMKRRADDVAARAEEKQREFEQSSPVFSTDHQLGTQEPVGSTATMAMPPSP